MGLRLEQNSAPVVANLPSVGDVVLGKYRIDGHIGQGGMGVVLEAYHLKLEQKVALKLLHPHAASSPDAVARFAREGRAAARLAGPHVARVYDVEETAEGLPFLVMERLRGEDLATRLAREVRFATSQAVGYVLEACEGLAEAHAKGVVHRDLKPENLFLAEVSDGSTVCKLLDFGISKLLFGHGEPVGEPTLRPGTLMQNPLAAARPPRAPASAANEVALTGAQSLMGTPSYMAPEQVISPMSVDERADIWSIGVILYELLAGETPFNGASPNELLMSIAVDDVPPLPTALHVPAALEATLRRCLMKDYRERYPDVFSLAQDLVPFGGPAAAAHLARIARYAGRPVATAPATRTRPSVATLVAVTLAGTAVACLVAFALWRIPRTSVAVNEAEIPAARAVQRDATVAKPRKAQRPPLQTAPTLQARKPGQGQPARSSGPPALRSRSAPNPLTVDIKR